MKRQLKAFLIATTAVALSGCLSNVDARRNGVTDGTGNAIAANTVLQMVDPWPAGVQQTGLRVPSQRPATDVTRQLSRSTTGYKD